ncbi:DUF5979 domain-containing protein [Nocardioides daejeonensis]|uniref:DUF5979 domain-containing protein n=1 Tax=Nocardioides daejeonensis TaxID=1046556 RepID=UPI0013A55F7A|nr:DUF5979 domain-containing protein [Nocardioides daejeonensis]
MLIPSSGQALSAPSGDEPTTTPSSAPVDTEQTDDSGPADQESPSSDPARPKGARADAVPTSQVGITKETNLAGGTLEPGQEFLYTVVARCSGLEAGCVNQQIVDVLPEGLDVTSLPTTTNTRTVAYDGATRTLTITFTEALQAPVGATGLNDGRQVAIEIGMRLPADTPLPAGTTIRNTASTDADNAPRVEDSADVEVTIPRKVVPVATKSWTDGAAVARSDEESTINLGIRNGSTSTVHVDELVVTDAARATFEHFDLTEVRVTRWPRGADRAQLLVCTEALSDCADGDYVAGAATSDLGALSLPAGISVEDVTGFRVRFFAADGSSLPYDATGGTVEADMVLRQQVRSTGEDLAPSAKQTVRNTAVPGVVEDGEVTEGDPVHANYDILPDTVVIGTTKSFFADTDGNFNRENGEYAVVGHRSPVSAKVEVKNNSPFALQEIRIVEPDPGTAGAEFDKLDTKKVRLRLPSGATNARLVVTYDDGHVATTDHDTGTTVDVERPGTQVVKIEVVYTGKDADGKATIAVGATAGLDLHGNLTDDVTDADLPNGTSPGVVNAAGTSAKGQTTVNGTGTAVGVGTATLQVERERITGEGVKTVGQGEIPADQPIPFTLRLRNNGNLPLVDPILSDPPVDADGKPRTGSNPFAVLRLVSATVRKDSGTPAVAIEVFDPATDAWVAYAAGDADLLTRATGVRALVDGALTPTKTVYLDLVTERRDEIDDTELTFSNCFVVDADNLPDGDPVCSPDLTVKPASSTSSLNKQITPTKALVEQIPGVGKQTAQVELTMVNTGNVNARRLVLTDDDADFFDAVDLGRVHSLRFPLGADRVRIDTLVDGTWVEGAARAKLADDATYPLPTGVNAAAVTGVRVTFFHSSGDYRLRPCDKAYVSGQCEGTVKLEVHPRETLRSAPTTAIPTELENTVEGGVESPLDPEGELREAEPNDATLEFVPGNAKLDVDKTPNTAISPGETAPFRLEVTNNGTANLPRLVVRDLLPEGLAFNEEFDGDDGQPFRIVDTEVPAGTAPVPAPTFTLQRDGDRVVGLTWEFGDWVFRPGARFFIEIEATLAPGVREGDKHTNLMGATADHDQLVCTGPGQADGELGDGLWCTDDAVVTTKAGAAFQARKWVAGTPELGWYDTRTESAVPAGDASCPVRRENGVAFTAHPCVALVNPGDEFDYLLSMVNAGTEPATDMRIIDRFPIKGDKGVVLDQTDRRTEWDSRPVLASEPRLNGAGVLTTLYADSEAELCTDDLRMGADCAAGTWGAAFGPDAVGMQMRVKWDQPLAPGDGVTLGFTMRAPLEVTQVADPTVAWNSFGHAEITRRAGGGSRTLPPTEPIKVGVAQAYGVLEVAKEIAANPGKLPVEDLTYEMAYRCTVDPVGNADPFVVADGTLQVPGGSSQSVTGLPAGAECEVWETEAHGGVSNYPVEAPAKVTIQPSLGAVATKLVTVTNSFPLADLAVVKKVEGEAADFGGAADYRIQVQCTMDGVTAAGFPRVVTITGSGRQRLEAPVGSLCTATELEDGGATRTEVDPSAGVRIVAGTQEELTITVTNTFDRGTLRIKKLLSGAGTELAAGPFEFTTACTFEGREFGPFTTVVRRTGDATELTAAVDALLPIGASCTVTETDDGGADETPQPVTVQIVENDEDNTVVATFTNEFSAGPVALEKLLAGDGADRAWATDATFAVDVTCAVGTAEQVVHSAEIRIRGGEKFALTHPDGEPVLLPLGARCWAQETETGGATSVSTNADSFDNAVEVTAGTPQELQALQLVVTNTFDLGSLEVTKKVDGAAAHFAEGREYTVAVTCVLPQDGVRTELFAAQEHTVTAGKTVVIDGLPVGAECWVAEPEAGGATHTVISASDQGSPAVVPGDGAAQVLVTNTFDAGELAVTKKVEGATATRGPFHFALACTTGQGAVGLADDEASFTLKADQSKSFTVPLGAHCVVTEKDVADGVKVAFDDSDAKPDGKVTVSPEASVTVTNTFPDRGLLDDEDKSDDRLPNAGGPSVLILIGGLLAVLTGGVLLSRRRRRA